VGLPHNELVALDVMNFKKLNFKDQI
jgi:hypothetical protein